MIERPSARLFVLDRHDRVLLFRFAHKQGPLAGNIFWATPGGGLDPGESYEQAACRKLLEEVGLRIADPGPQVARRETILQMPDGDMAHADERFFLVRADGLAPSQEGWTDLEREVMTEHRWWTQAELRATGEQVWPENIADMLAQAGIWPRMNTRDA
jgi:8-oxo-dGTP pyrophosphatase MutT (NUDIX family)